MKVRFWVRVAVKAKVRVAVRVAVSLHSPDATGAPLAPSGVHA